MSYSKKKSVILDSFLWSKLLQLSTKLKKDKDWYLVYRGTLDGFDAEDFHREFDGVAKTVTIVKTTNGNIFGGYTDLPWCSNADGKRYIASNAFIFSLVNGRNQPFIAYVDCSVWCQTSWGPCFGTIHAEPMKLRPY